MKFKFDQTRSLPVAPFILYLLPFLFFSSYSIGLMSDNKSWSVLSLGLLTVLVCFLILTLYIRYREEAFKFYIRENLSAEEESEKKNDKVTAIDSPLPDDIEI